LKAVTHLTLYGNYRPAFPFVESTPSLSARGDDDGANPWKHAFGRDRFGVAVLLGDVMRHVDRLEPLQA